MKCEELGERLVESWQREPSGPERAALAAHLAECATCRAEAGALERLWRGLDDLPDESPSPQMRARFEAMLAEETARERSTRLVRPDFEAGRRGAVARAPRLSRFAAIAATLAVGVLAGIEISRRGSEQQLADLGREVASLRETVTLALLAESSPSERLRGVAYGRSLPESDDRVTAALLEALSADPNVNVRLAALEALRPLAGSAAGRPRLVAALASQESPLVQLSLVDLLLESDGQAARADVDQLLANPDLDPVVRGYVRGRLGGTV